MENLLTKLVKVFFDMIFKKTESLEKIDRKTLQNLSMFSAIQ